MKKLTMRFCERNLEEEGTRTVMEYQKEHQSSLVNVETYRCLGNCTICNQGPYCTVNDILFQKNSPEELNVFLNELLAKLRQSLKEHHEKMMGKLSIRISRCLAKKESRHG